MLYCARRRRCQNADRCVGGHEVISRWISRLLRYAPAEERAGIRLKGQPYWEVSHPEQDQLPVFLRLLPALMPAGSILCLEGQPAAAVRSYLESRRAGKTTKVAVATIWPRPVILHTPLTAENVNGLADLAERHVAPEVAHHLHVYMGDQVFLEWYDVPFDPLWISKALPEERVAAFCSELGLRYTDDPSW